MNPKKSGESERKTQIHVRIHRCMKWCVKTKEVGVDEGNKVKKMKGCPEEGMAVECEHCFWTFYFPIPTRPIHYSTPPMTHSSHACGSNHPPFKHPPPPPQKKIKVKNHSLVVPIRFSYFLLTPPCLFVCFLTIIPCIYIITHHSKFYHMLSIIEITSSRK